MTQSPAAAILDEFVHRGDALAIIHLAHGTDGEDAIRAAEAAIKLAAWEADSWRCAGAIWNAMNQPDGLARIVDSFTALDEVPESASEVLTSVLTYTTEYAQRDAEFVRFVEWFTSRAGPNQAEIVTEWLLVRWPSVRELTPVPVTYGPLVDWAFRNAAGTLLGSSRTGGFSAVALRTLLVYADNLRPKERVLATRLLMTSRSLDLAAQADGGSVEVLWPQLERALVAGADPGWIRDGLASSVMLRYALRVPSIEQALYGNVDEEVRKLREYPKLHALVCRWVAVRDTRPETGSYEDLEALARRASISQASVERDLLVESSADGIADLVGAVTSGSATPAAAKVLERIAEYIAVTDLVRRALRTLSPEQLARRGVNAAQFTGLLDAPGNPVVAAAVRLLVPFQPRPQDEALSATEHAEVAATLTELLRIADEFRDLHVFVRQASRGVRRVTIVDKCPDSEYAVQLVEGTWLAASADTYAKLLREHPGERGQQLCALYFAHELLHHAQGLADKEGIVEVRRHGSELLVMELDLVADAIAIEWVARLGRAGWTRAALLDATLHGLESFPASAHHTQSSIERKSLRIVCHVFTKLLQRDEYGFAWLELPPLDGVASLWWSHPDRHQIAAFHVTGAVSGGLRGVARDLALGRSFANVERECQGLLDRARRIP